jgi:hypothetical protein
MNNFFTSKLMGGLGNYLFQISTTYAMSLKYNKKIILDKKDIITGHNPYVSYTDNIFKKLYFDELKNDYFIFFEDGFHFNEIPYYGGNMKLVGYFQSEKYFKPYRNEILNLFDFPKIIKDKINSKYGKEINDNPCSIHVRRGDYIDLQNYHTVLPVSYYKKAIDIIGQDKNYLIFSDDYDWCVKNLNFIKNKTFIRGNTDYDDLYLMSICKDNIIANSSFSWWGAWLNNNQNKIIISPKDWFGPMNKHLITDDLYCDLWIKI